jgi:hypothetical protein
MHYYVNYILIIVATIMFTLLFATLEQKNVIMRQHENLRKQYEQLSCKCHGIGSSGGFCLDKDNFNVGGNHVWCKRIAEELRRLFHRQSVYDFGAGLGWYGRALLSNETDGYRLASYQAFDGATNIESIVADGFVKYLDLSQPVNLPMKDWVLSLEVGEHIPVQFESIFIQNLHRHNRNGIILSWAVQGNGRLRLNSFFRLHRYRKTKNERPFIRSCNA